MKAVALVDPIPDAGRTSAKRPPADPGEIVEAALLAFRCGDFDAPRAGVIDNGATAGD